MKTRCAFVLFRAAFLVVLSAGIPLSAFAAPPKYELIRVPLPGIKGLYASLGLELNDSGDALIRFYDARRPTTQTARLYKDSSLIDFAPGADQVLGEALNARGDVVGTFTHDFGLHHAYVYVGGQFVELAEVELPDGTFVPTYANDINDNRRAIGEGHYMPDGSTRPFFWKDGRLEVIPLGNFASLFGVAVNNSGHITGPGRTTDGESHVFLYRNRETIDLGTIPGYSSINGSEISDSGIIGGFGFTTGNISHVFRYSNGAMVDLGNLGGELADVYAMNNSGHLVGVSENPNGDRRAFLEDGKGMIDLGTFGGPSSVATDITDNGQITGSATKADGSSRAFIYGAGSGVMSDLNGLISDDEPLKALVTLHEGVRVNEFGQILAQGRQTGVNNERTYIASPIDSTRPVVKAIFSGTSGTNGWFTSDVGLRWTTTDAQAPIAKTVGCVTSSVTADTPGKAFSCKAVSIGGTAAKTVTIKRDTVVPIATIARPTNGAVYARNQTVIASYSCSDGLSGIRSCAGPVANGSAIDTSTAVSDRKFTVRATDKAGLTRTIIKTYSVQ